MSGGMPERKACRETREKHLLPLRAPPRRMHIAIGFMNSCHKWYAKRETLRRARA